MRLTLLKPGDILSIIRPIEARGALETAHRVMQICGKVLRYAVATERAERDITADLCGAPALQGETRRHHHTHPLG